MARIMTRIVAGLGFSGDCHPPPFLTESRHLEVHPALVKNLLLGRWFPAMNALWQGLFFSEALGIEVSELFFACFTQRSLSFTGPSIHLGCNIKYAGPPPRLMPGWAIPSGKQQARAES